VLASVAVPVPIRYSARPFVGYLINFVASMPPFFPADIATLKWLADFSNPVLRRSKRSQALIGHMSFCSPPDPVGSQSSKVHQTCATEVRDPGPGASGPGGRLAVAGLLLALVAALAATGKASAAQLKLAWDPVQDARVGLYQVHFGVSSGTYGSRLDTIQTSAVIGGLLAGQRYYLTVRACTPGGAICSGFSNEVSATATDPLPTAKPVAAPSNGTAPSTAPGSAPASGTVPVVVAGSSAASPGREPHMEVGEVRIDHRWQWVPFTAPFADPIVVAQPLSGAGDDPAVVRVKGIARGGFWIRVQEWDYLDGSHPDGQVSYLVMERGRHPLADGTRVEAGRLSTATLVSATFGEPFDEPPVVLAGVTSVNDPKAVVTRLRNITAKGLQVVIQEQESSQRRHLSETIDYIAWEPSFGRVNGLRYAVGRLGAGVSSTASSFLYPIAFAVPPRFLADMQTMNGSEPANLRWRNRNEATLEVWVAEEQSRDTETRHVAESVGYLVLERP
jgi:hypothetical protein